MKLQNKIFLSFLLSFMVLQVTCKSFFRKDLQKFDNTIQGFEQFDLYTKRNFLGYVKDKNGFSPGMVYEGMVKKDKPEGIFKKKYDSRTKLGASARVQGMFSFGTKLDLIEEVEIELINPRVETLENPKILNSFANDENMKKMKYISSVMYADEVKVKLKTQKGVDFDAKAYLNQQLPGLQVGVENSIQKGEEEFTFWKDVYIGYQLRSYDGKFVPSESETKMKVVVLPFESNNKEKEEYQTFLQMATVSVLHELQVSVQERSSKQKELESKYMEDISIVNELSANTLLSGKLYFAGNKAKIYCDLKDKYGEVIQGSHIDYTINLEGKDVFVVEEEWKKLLLEKYNFLAPETKNVETKPSNFATSNEEAYISYIKGNEKYLEMSEKSLEESETLLKKAIELDPKFYKAHALLSEVYSSRYYLYHVYNESSYEKYKSLSKEAAQKSLALAANEYKPNRAMALYYDLIEENSKESKKYFEKVLKVKPEDALSKVFLTFINTIDKQNFETKQEMLDAYNLNPNLFYSNQLYGYWLQKFNAMEEAKEKYEKAVSIFPSILNIYVLLASMYDSEKLYNKSLTYLEEANKKVPNNLYLHTWLVRLAEKSKNYDKAIQYAENALLLKPQIFFYESLGSLYLKKGDKQKSKEYYLDACSKGSKKSCDELKKIL